MTDLTNFDTETYDEVSTSATVKEFLKTVGRPPTDVDEFWRFGGLVTVRAEVIIAEAWADILKHAADQLNQE